MKKGYAISLAFFICLAACRQPVKQKTVPSDNKIPLGNFVINAPANWQYSPAQGEAEAMVLGKIMADSFILYYNNSIFGEPNTVLYTKDQLLQRQLDWMRDCLYCLPGVGYDVLDSADHSIPFVLKKRSGNGFPTVKVKANPKTEIKLVKNTQAGAETPYLANITHGKIKINLPIDAPNKTALYNIATDTMGRYVRQIITPKNGQNGVTGLFLKEPNKDYIFSLTGDNLTPKDRAEVVSVFKTIKFKE